MSRRQWTDLDDDRLLSQCEVDTYRASGPGGQKRNKTSSAVRIRHPPSGLIVIAEESRSQHENRKRAFRRLRQALYLKLREQPGVGANDLGPVQDLLQGLRNAAGRLEIGRKDARFWPAVGIVLDVLGTSLGSVRDAAQVLGITTGNLVSFLEIDPKVWEQANLLRGGFGLKPLRTH